MQPIGWKLCSVPNKAPTRETSELKTGILLATTYAAAMTAVTQPSHVTQCVAEFATRCLEPLRMRTKTLLLANY